MRYRALSTGALFLATAFASACVPGQKQVAAHPPGPNPAALECFKANAPKMDDRAAAILCNSGTGEAGMNCFRKLEPDYDDVAAALVCVDGSEAALKCFLSVAVDTDDVASAMICTHKNAVVLSQDQDQDQEDE